MTWLATAKSKFVSMGRDTRANIAVSFALSFGVMATAAGGGLDYSRSVGLGTELQAALDSGVLAAASMTQTRDPESVMRSYVEAAIGDHPSLVDSLVIEVTSERGFNSREVSATASLNMPTTLLGLAGINSLTVHREAKALEKIRDIEISLVLDISGSMNGSKIRALREAAQEFIDVVLADNPGRTSVSLIPYNGGVRLPAEVTSNGLIDAPLGLLRQTVCPEHGTEYPIQVDLTDVELEILRWGGQPMQAGSAGSFCPERDETSVFMTNDRNDLVERIQALDVGGDTGLDIATAWGARALDPVWRGRMGGNFADRPAAYDDENTIKVLVVMTDGAATAQIRREHRGGRWRNVRLYSARTARENMAEACDTADGNGVHIYTIAFQLSGTTNRDLMRNCASREENYFPIENTDIGTAFSAIASDINRLRITS
ncbi:VWA domain-containing protein [Maricaulaceae bacterium NA33B04]|nr:VWA domain-containing protein [Maricaulaceae bacterium NA33B04]